MHPSELLRVTCGAVAILLIGAGVFVRTRLSHEVGRMGLAAAVTVLATAIVVWSGLLLRNAAQLRLLEPLARPAPPTVAALALRRDRYGTSDKRRALLNEVMSRLAGVPGLDVDDPGSGLPLAGGAYFAVFFQFGREPTPPVFPRGQEPVRWRASIDPASLAQAVNRAVKSFDRGIHYWHVGDHPRAIVAAFTAFGIIALLLTFVGFRDGSRHRGVVALVVGIAVGLVLARATTWLLTGQLWGVSVTDPTVFAAGAGLTAAVALVGTLAGKRRLHV